MTQIITVYDWDDTLFPTTVISRLASSQRRPILDIIQSPTLKLQFRQLEAILTRILELSLRMGPVYCVTNSQTGWVGDTITTFIPGVRDLMTRIPVISAIDLHAQARNTHTIPRALYPTDGGIAGSAWKYLAICQILQNPIPTTLLSIGDSDFEREAADMIRHEIGQSNLVYRSPISVQTIKMVDQPTFPSLLNQLYFLEHNLAVLVALQQNPTLRV